MKHVLLAFALVALLGGPWFVVNHPDQARAIGEGVRSFAGSVRDQVAAVILSHNPKTAARMQADYMLADFPMSPKVRILIVPGHEPTYGGAEYRSENGNIKERDFAVELATDLRQFLESDNHYEVYVTRDTKDWAPEFKLYFKERWDDIVAWNKASKREISSLRELGSVKLAEPTVYHNDVPSNVATRLYGITKWSNENDIDIVIHVHFNDETEHASGVPGDHSGFAIYVPDLQYGNGSTTRLVAGSIFKHLERYSAVSSLKGESSGIVSDPDLIAIGANNTSDAASLLIEYAYVYEPVMTKPSVRPEFIRELAYETYLGLQDFFVPDYATVVNRQYDTLILPYAWKDPMDGKDDQAMDVFALQTALIVDGVYPPEGESLNDCPRTGKFGPCTKASLQEFQSKHGITGEEDVAGAKTIKKLNQLYSAKPI